MNIKYIITVQCDIVKERCSGYLCEEAFHNRQGGFSNYPKDADIRFLSFTCGGCCGRATLRKLSNALKLLKKRAGITTEEVALHFSSCICRESFHGPKCPHYDYLKELVERKEVKWFEGTRISDKTQSRTDENGKWIGRV